MSQPITWERRAEAYKAVHDAIRSLLTSPPTGKKITKFEFTYSDGNLNTITAYDGVDLIFTLTFTWNADGTVQSISRS